jgi:hypothetical protein
MHETRALYICTEKEREIKEDRHSPKSFIIMKKKTKNNFIIKSSDFLLKNAFILIKTR